MTSRFSDNDNSYTTAEQLATRMWMGMRIEMGMRRWMGLGLQQGVNAASKAY